MKAAIGRTSNPLRSLFTAETLIIGRFAVSFFDWKFN